MNIKPPISKLSLHTFLLCTTFIISGRVQASGKTLRLYSNNPYLIYNFDSDSKLVYMQFLEILIILSLTVFAPPPVPISLIFELDLKNSSL